MGRMHIVYHSLIPRMFGVAAITLYPFILFRNHKFMVRPETVNHERIHYMQIKRDGVCRFYIQYAYEWLRNILKGMSPREAYRSISYEVEAYEHQDDATYIP